MRLCSPELSEYCLDQRVAMDALKADRRARGAAVFPAGVVANWAFDDFEAMAAFPRAWGQHYLKLTPGPFHGRLDLVHTARLQIGAVS